MSDAQEDHDEASNTSFEADTAKDDGGAKRDPESPIYGDDSSSSIFLTEFSNEDSENDYVSGSDYDSSSSLYSSEKEERAKSSKSDSKSGRPKRAYRKPRKRHRTDVNQLKRLEEVYQYDSNPNQELRAELAKESGMSTRQIQVWFQNRRAKTRRDAARMQVKPDPKEVPSISPAAPAATEDPASTADSAPPAQGKPPKEPKKRGPKGKRNARTNHRKHKHKHGHNHDDDDNEDNYKEEENGESKKRRRRGRKRTRVDKDDSSQSELSSESAYSEGDSSSSSSSSSGSSSESSSSSSAENTPIDPNSEFPNPSYLYQKVLDYLKKDGKIDPQESIEQDEKRLFG